MTAYVFLGPTLPGSAAREVLDAVYLPPAAQGDVYRVARAGAAAIGIVDGYFDTLPAVWHKEILWALSQGIAVFGASSMGALRAAELHAFGMRGVGEVFEAFRDGRLEDDDEVTLAHEPETSLYRAQSAPMVNVRATLAAAVEAGVLGDETRTVLAGIAKGLFYPDRTYRRILQEARAAVAAPELDELAAWLPAGQRDVKRADALAMLATMKAHLGNAASAEPLLRPRFHFEHTVYWDGLVSSVDSAGAMAETHLGLLGEELALRPELAGLVRARASARSLARRLGERAGVHLTGDSLAREVEEFRQSRGLLEEGSLGRWLAAHDLDLATLAQILEENLTIDRASEESSAARSFAAELRLDEAYPALKARALAKDRALVSAGLSEPGEAETQLTQEELLAWYDREIAPLDPAGERSSDLERVAKRAGFGDASTLLRAVAREILFRRRGSALCSEPYQRGRIMETDILQSEQQTQGVLVRGPDGNLYFIPESKLSAFKVPDKGTQEMNGRLGDGAMVAKTSIPTDWVQAGLCVVRPTR